MTLVNIHPALFLTESHQIRTGPEHSLTAAHPAVTLLRLQVNRRNTFSMLYLKAATCMACRNLRPFLLHLINPLNPELNPIRYLLALLAHHFLHVSRIRVKSLTLRLLMSYIHIWSAYS